MDENSIKKLVAISSFVAFVLTFVQKLANVVLTSTNLQQALINTHNVIEETFDSFETKKPIKISFKECKYCNLEERLKSLSSFESIQDQVKELKTDECDLKNHLELADFLNKLKKN